MKILLTSMLVVILATLVASPASATVIYWDTFESYDISSGPIDVVGLTAPSGQTYTASPGALAGLPDPLTSMEVRTDAGILSTQGAGATTSQGIRAASVLFGATYSTGIYTLGIDYRISGGGEPQLFLGSDTGTGNLSVVVEGSPLQVALQGAPWTWPANTKLTGGFFTTPADVRLVTTVDLDTKSITVSWQGLDAVNAGVSGSYTESYSNAYSFSALHLYDGARSNPHGFDNIILVTGDTIPDGYIPEIPEPSTLALLAAGLLGLLCYAWRKRK